MLDQGSFRLPPWLLLVLRVRCNFVSCHFVTVSKSSRSDNWNEVQKRLATYSVTANHANSDCTAAPAISLYDCYWPASTVQQDLLTFFRRLPGWLLAIRVSESSTGTFARCVAHQRLVGNSNESQKVDDWHLHASGSANRMHMEELSTR